MSNSTCRGRPSAAEVVLPESAALGSAPGCLAALACSSAALQHAHPTWLSRYLITIQGTSICHTYALLGPAHQMCVPQQHHGKLSWEAPVLRTVLWWPAAAALAAPARQRLPARGWRFRPWTQQPAAALRHQKHVYRHCEMATVCSTASSAAAAGRTLCLGAPCRLQAERNQDGQQKSAPTIEVGACASTMWLAG